MFCVCKTHNIEVKYMNSSQDGGPCELPSMALHRDCSGVINQAIEHAQVGNPLD